MLYRTLADLVMVIHFGWIVFMFWGVVLTVRGLWRPAFFDRWLFRSLHAAGILVVAGLEILGCWCPLTVWENLLRRHYDSGTNYPGSFIVGWLERVVYPHVDPVVVVGPTIAMATFTLIVFVVRPPARFRRSKLHG
jgi:hypothetical protein